MARTSVARAQHLACNLSQNAQEWMAYQAKSAESFDKDLATLEAFVQQQGSNANSAKILGLTEKQLALLRGMRAEFTALSENFTKFAKQLAPVAKKLNPPG